MPEVTSAPMRPQPGAVVCNRFKLSHILRETVRSILFKAQDLTLGQFVCVKFSTYDLAHEYQIMLLVQTDHGIPKPLWYSKGYSGFSVLALPLLCYDFSVAMKIPAASIMIFVGIMLLRLEHCHNRQVVHGDIKPSNFMYKGADCCDASDIYLIDFGAAKDLREEVVSDPEQLEITPLYASPRVQRGNTSTKRDDLWSLAITALALLRTEEAIPWFTLCTRLGAEEIAVAKESCNIPALFEGYPPVFAEFCSYANELGAEQEPDHYPWIRKFLKDA